MREICGECNHNAPDWDKGILRGYLCVKEDSPYFAEYVEYTDGCEEWEQKGIDL